MSVAKEKTRLKTFHATMVVTRLEEWCVDAETVEEAKAQHERESSVRGLWPQGCAPIPDTCQGQRSAFVALRSAGLTERDLRSGLAIHWPLLAKRRDDSMKNGVQ